MKKIVVICLLLLILCSGTTAFAADNVRTEYVKTENGEHYFTTSGNLDNAKNAFVTVVVTDGNAITVDSLQYVDQGVTDGSGNFLFANYIPKQAPQVGQEYAVKVGVWGRGTPVSCAPLTLPVDAPVYSIAGEISFEGTRSQGIVTLYDAQGTLLAEMQKPAGTYAFSMLEPGVYTVKFEKQSHLPEVREAEITNAHITGVNASLKAGDVTGDKIINLSDFGVVTSMFGQEAGSAEQKKADFMEDGTVNIHELTKMIENYGEDRRSE